MLTFMADNDFNGRIRRGLLRWQTDLDLVRVQDVSLGKAIDPVILEYAAAEGRIVLTHDRKTMPSFAIARVARGEKMPGVLVVNKRMPIGHAIDEILLYAHAALPEEMENQVIYLPM
jgi:predicted nuclease of predicted toxin-antitoxin system